MNEREAFDLHNKACRENVKKSFKLGFWRYGWWWSMLFSDTYNRVCSKKENGDDEK